MIYPVTAADKIKIMPVTVTEEVLQNVRTILSTIKGTVFMNRTFGISADLIDEPLNIAKARIEADIIEAVEEWEPRARVDSIEYQETSMAKDGRLLPVIYVEVLI